MDIRSTLVIGWRMILPSLVMTMSWLPSTVTRRTVLMSRSSVSPSLVTMTRRCAAAGGAAAGCVPDEGCAAPASPVLALSPLAALPGERAPRRRGAGVVFGAAGVADSAFVSALGSVGWPASDAGLVSAVSAGGLAAGR